jgi:hypothetical protein
MEAGEICDDRRPAAALADKWTAVRFGRRIMAVEARLDSCDCGFEERIFDQYPFATIHRFLHWA